MNATTGLLPRASSWPGPSLAGHARAAAALAALAQGEHVDERRDVVVVGAGPAGVASALFLAQRGLDVLLLDAARFPRDKVCGESVSPGAWPVLDALGLSECIGALAPQAIHGMRLCAPGGRGFRGEYACVERPGFALPRRVLDHALLRAAQAAGVEVREQTPVVELRRCARQGLTGVVVDTPGDHWRVIEAPLVIAADGRRSRVARALGLLHEHPRLRKFALRGYWEGVAGLEAFGELHVGHGRYCGIAPLGPGQANVACVLDQRDMRASGGQLEEFYREALRSWPGVHERLAGARLIEPPRAIGPLALVASRCSAPGALLVGDAAGFFDPFTGEGITLALRSAAWAAPVGAAFVHAGRRRQARSLQAYERERYRATRDKFRLNRLLYEIVARPVLADWLAARLAVRPRLADRLVGIAGDFVPARDAWGPGLLAELWRG